MKCYNCGEKVKKNYNLCPNCGKKVVIIKSENKFKFTKKQLIMMIGLLVVLTGALCFLLFKGDNVKTVRKSVVKINVYDKSGEVIQTGSGFIMFDKNILVTNAHVITGGHSADAVSEEDEKIFIDGALYYSQDEDIAILKLNNQNSLKPLKIGRNYDVGDKVIAIGSPLGIKNSVSDGMISNINDGYIQHTAPISSGSSGGTLFNSKGKVIGMNTATISSGQNINLAIPIENIKEAYKLSKNNKVSKINKIQYTTDEKIKSIILNNKAGKEIIKIVNEMNVNDSIWAFDIKEYKDNFASGYYMYEIADNNLVSDWIQISINSDLDSNYKYREPDLSSVTIYKLNDTSEQTINYIIGKIKEDAENSYQNLLKDPTITYLISPENSDEIIDVTDEKNFIIVRNSTDYINAIRNPIVNVYNNYIYEIVGKDREVMKKIEKLIKQLP